jgi:hypothetical protein
MENMKNKNVWHKLNRYAWILAIGLGGYMVWSVKTGCFPDYSNNGGNPTLLKKMLKPTGPYVFYRNDSVDVHTVEADFLQYYDMKTYAYAHKEAMNTIFECSTEDNLHKISVRLHPIEVPPTHYEMPDKMIVVNSDVSNVDNFIAFLIHNGIMNKKYEWSFGKGHLVFANVWGSSSNSFIFWLMYKLEYEAKQGGGHLHYVLSQDPFQRIRKNREQDDHSKPAFYRLKNWDIDTILQKNSEQGRWVYSKNAVEKIGGFLIVQAGVNSAIKDNIPLDTINNLMREVYQNPLISDYGDYCLNDNQQKRIFKPESIYPDYNRQFNDILSGGIYYEKNRSEKLDRTKQVDENVDRLLKLYDAKHIIGYLPSNKETFETANNNKYIGFIRDAKKQGGSYNSNDIHYKGLWIENNTVYIIDDTGKKEILFKD